ncbi:hypothetical protein F2Q70_00035397 [Brassica cretica]|uniref:Uncharacterized protein n=1 Tax=Brassica cretica TaxID=69181 RepID=A0A8S9JVR0_BRACR|nr:hypothetical protein F2Q70_00035397 [Brassica cretica]KAF3529251.1 hypothetical protein DY000_02039015 [Brassica cretica]
MREVHNRVLTFALQDDTNPDLEEEEECNNITTDLHSHTQQKIGNMIRIRLVTPSERSLRRRRMTCSSKAYWREGGLAVADRRHQRWRREFRS